MDNSLDADIYVEEKPEPENIPDLELTDNFRVKHNYYCEYINCDNRHSKLVPFQTGKDWSLRIYHKKCWTYMNKIRKINDFDIKISDLTETNVFNPVFHKCKCNKLDGKPCTMKADTEGFNKKFGYCKYHNKRKFHLIYH